MGTEPPVVIGLLGAPRNPYSAGRAAASLRSVPMTRLGAIAAQGPAMQRAAVPVTWGVAMLVPEIVL